MNSASHTVLVPVCEYLVASQRAAVRDARTGALRWFPAVCTLGPGGLVCARASSERVAGGKHLVRLPGGASAWVSCVIELDAPPLDPSGRVAA